MKPNQVLPAILIILSIFIFMYMLRDVYSFGVDDSFIFYRYAENLSNGHGFAFNPGEPWGEGFTSWVWMLALASFHHAGVDIIFASKALGIFFHLMSAGLVYLLVKRIVGSDSPVSARITAGMLSMVFLLNYQSIAHSVSGMETSLYIFSILLLVYCATLALQAPPDGSGSPWWLVVTAASAWAFFVRPEGIAAGGISLLALAIHRRRDLVKFKTWLYVFIALVVPLTAFIIIKIAIFGYPLPHSFYHKFIIKGPEYSVAFRQFLSFIGNYWWLVIPAFVSSVYTAVKYKRYFFFYYPVLFALMCGLYLFFYPVMNYLHRFYIPYLALLLAAVSFGLYELVKRVKLFRHDIVRFLIVLFMFSALVFGINWNMGTSQFTVKGWKELVKPEVYRARLGRVMSYLPRGVTVANSEMGVIPYYSGLTCIDMAGLTDPYIAHHGLSMTYLKQRNTDLILFPRDVEKIFLSQWDTFGIDYKAIFLSGKFKNDYEAIGSFIAWPGSGKKYYLYADKTSPRFADIKQWREKYSNEFAGL